MNEPEVLILSNKHDYSTDYICVELERRKIPYLRLNRDTFSDYNIVIDLSSMTLKVAFEENIYCIRKEHLRSVYYRAPVFLRSSKPYSINEQLQRGQWSAFLRNLIIFEDAIWINHPVKTYQAESKLLQLKAAKSAGFEVPHTWCGNSLPNEIGNEKYIVKSLDTALFYDQGIEKFTYSSIVGINELKKASLKKAPVIIQELIQDKVDLRVTIVGNELFPVSIEDENGGIVGDWRKTPKESLVYKAVGLPDSVKKSICKMMSTLGLVFGGLDLAFSNGKYYFIEVNPTGEWGWLNRATAYPIDSAIVNALSERTIT